MTISVKSTGDVIELQEQEGKSVSYIASCSTNPEFNGKAHGSCLKRNGKEVMTMYLDNGKKHYNIAVTEAEWLKLMKRDEIMPTFATFVCWECGRTFHHRPCADGTCGEC